MLTVPRLNALKNLAKLIPHLVELMIHFLTEALMFLFKAPDLLLQPINALIVNLLGDRTLWW